tara:strand:+ start:1613 stop:1810 length:198 start_codon:yes stop_codon:yes gene_type:complete
MFGFRYSLLLLFFLGMMKWFLYFSSYHFALMQNEKKDQALNLRRSIKFLLSKRNELAKAQTAFLF